LARSKKGREKQQKRTATKKKETARQKDKAKQAGKRPPTHFSRRYTNPQILAAAGPLLRGVWSVPFVLAEQLVAAGRTVPPPVAGDLLLDTGASRTCISQTAADELELKPLRLQVGYGAGGQHRLPVYRAQLSITIVGHGQQTIMNWETEAQGIPHLQESLDHLGIVHHQKDGQKIAARLVGLLGRDILQHAVVTYDGIQGEFRVKFDLTGIHRASAFGEIPPKPT
jgi:hypothetical protein